MANIRKAVTADATRLAELRFEFRTRRSSSTESRSEFLDRCSRWMATRLETDTWHCWVAERAGEIVGHVWLHLIEKIPNPATEAEWHGYITNVYVQESARGGTGGALMDAALAWCESRDLDYIVLWPTERSRPLYGRKGFTVTDAIMAKGERGAHP